MYGLEQREAKSGPFVIIHKKSVCELSIMLVQAEEELTERSFFIHSIRSCLYESFAFANCTKKQQIGFFDVFILHILYPCVKMRTIMK